MSARTVTPVATMAQWRRKAVPAGTWTEPRRSTAPWLSCGTSISAGDVLNAEMQASSLIALPLLTGGTEAEHNLLAAALVDAAEARADEPERRPRSSAS